MKFKKKVIMVCCVIIAALGITLTGCFESKENQVDISNDTNAEISKDTNAEIDGDIDLRDENLYVGTWKATITEEADGSVYDYEKKGPVTEITLRADHTFSTRVNDDVDDDAGTWEFAGGGLEIIRKGFDHAFYAYKDGELIWVMETENGKSTTHFVRKQ